MSLKFLLTFGFAGILAGNASIPIYEIGVSSKSRDNFIADSIDPSSRKEPFAERAPKPFIYAQDFKVDGEGAFVVAGTNPTTRLKKIRFLTGLSMEALDLRMIASTAQGSARNLASIEKAWKGIGNVGMRRSNAGFLRTGEKLRDLLIKDNEWVIIHQTTHQKLTAPLLIAIEAHEKNQSDATFTFNSKNYTVKASKMGGDSFFYELLKKDDIRRTDRSGWIGFGLQGSPFQDEIFANWYFEIVSANGKVLRGDALTVQLIYRYGFYQGGKFRMEPQAIHSMFF